jgi:hypothetical protein
MMKICLVSIWDSKIPGLCCPTNETFGNLASFDCHQVRGNAQSLGFRCRWQNKVSSFFNNPCMVFSLKVITPKIESSSSTMASSKGVSILGFWNKKQLAIVASKPCYHVLPPYELFWPVL